MLFPSVIFLNFFFPLFLLAYFFLPWRNATFLLFSFFFFYWGEDKYIFVLLAFIAINYLFGRLMACSARLSRKKLFLAIGVAGNLGLFFYYKYFTFTVTRILPDVLGIPAPDVHHPHLPLGISYFTFHGISYLVDVYRGISVPSGKPLNVALYISMFPHMVAGPIVRYHTVAKAMVRRHVTLGRALFAVRLFVIGLAQKMLLADTLGLLANTIYALPQEAINTTSAWLGSIAYTLQIYFDFCGYSFMAIAIGLLLGFRLPRNFNYPYFSQSITEFWRRWHISLSTWFRDYLYIPLGGNRKSHWRTYVNLLVVFLLCGLWHGAAYTFLGWGFFHGLLLIVERLGWGRLLHKLPRGCRHLYTILMVMLGWILFRAESLDQVWTFITALIGCHAAPAGKTLAQLTTHEQQLVLVLGMLFSTPLLEQLGKRGMRLLGHLHLHWVGVAGKIVTLLVLCLLSYTSILAGNYSPFLYFRF